MSDVVQVLFLLFGLLALWIVGMLLLGWLRSRWERR